MAECRQGLCRFRFGVNHPRRAGRVLRPRRNLDVQKIHKAGFDVYFVERPATSVSSAVWLFAIDWSHGRGFFYSK